MLKEILFCLPWVLIGFLMLKAGLNERKKIKNCVKIYGKYIGCYVPSSRMLQIKFEYEFNNVKYKNSTKYGNCKDENKKEYIEGNIYPIYVNPQEPTFFRCSKRIIYGAWLVTGLIGGYFLELGLLAIFGILIGV